MTWSERGSWLLAAVLLGTLAFRVAVRAHGL